MAELVGVVASSIALVGVAGKVCKCIHSLRNTIAEIKDVPDKLALLMLEIEILEPVMSAMEREFSNDRLANWDDGTARLSLGFCQKALYDLTVLVEDLVQSIDKCRKSKRCKASIKILLEKDMLERCYGRLQSAVRLLGLTQQWYLIALTKTQPKVVVDNLIMHGLVHIPQNDVLEISGKLEDGAKERPISSHTDVRRTYPGDCESKRSVDSRHTHSLRFGRFVSLAWRLYQAKGKFNQKNFDLYARLQTNCWFAIRVWDIQVSRATSGWTLKLNPYCVQPDSSPVFWCARKGDTPGVLRLISEGQASLQDHTASGQSLMHLAAGHGHLDLFKVLAAHGLDLMEEEDCFKLNSLEAGVLQGIACGMDISATHQFYLESDAYVEGGLLITPSTTAYIYEALASMPPLAFKTLQPFCFPEFFVLDITERIKYFCFDDASNDTDMLRHFIRPDCVIRQEEISSLRQNGVCLLNLTALRYGPLAQRGPSPTVNSWRKLVREIIPLTEDLSSQGWLLDPKFQTHFFTNKGLTANPALEFLQRNPPMTALFTSLSYFRYETQALQGLICIRDLRRTIQATLILWLEDLTACQVDLNKYGRRERRMFLRNKELMRVWYGGCSDIRLGDSAVGEFTDMLRLVDFEYGPEPSDWRLHWDTEVERFTGDFWELVENPPLRVPGSWYDD